MSENSEPHTKRERPDKSEVKYTREVLRNILVDLVEAVAKHVDITTNHGDKNGEKMTFFALWRKTPQLFQTQL